MTSQSNAGQRSAVIVVGFLLFLFSGADAQNQFSPSATVKDGMVHYAIQKDASVLWVAKFDGPNYDTLPRLTFEDKQLGFAIVGENPPKPALALLHGFSISSSKNMVHSILGATGWGEWKNLSGQFLSRPAAVYYNGKVYVFGRGTDSYIYYASGNDSSFTGWTGIPGRSFATGVGAASGPDGIHVLATDAQGNVWQSVFNGSSWSSWTSLGCCASTASEPSITWSYDKVYDAEIRGTDNALYSKTFAPGGEGIKWSQLPGATQGAPAIVRDSVGDQMLVVYGTDGWNYYATRKASGGWSSFTRIEPARLTGRYIVDIAVTTGRTSAAACADGWLKIPQDLNAGAGGDYVYACVKYGPKDQALRSIGILNRSSRDAYFPVKQHKSYNTTFNTHVLSDGCDRGELVNTDLNSRAGGSYIYFCKIKNRGPDPQNVLNPDYITDIMFRVSATAWADGEKCGGGYFKTGRNIWQVTNSDYWGESESIDLNNGAGGKYIWLCIRGD